MTFANKELVDKQEWQILSFLIFFLLSSFGNVNGILTVIRYYLLLMYC